MTTAHQLARKLLAGADYEILIADPEKRLPQIARPVQTVESVNMMTEDRPFTAPCIVLYPEPSRHVVYRYGDSLTSSAK